MGHSWLQVSESPTRSDGGGKICALTKQKSEEEQALGSPPLSASPTVTGKTPVRSSVSHPVVRASSDREDMVPSCGATPGVP